ncbi:MAG TPA: NifB/NifX family molybdenum-iron cluster-binding protein, partial [Desulfobacteria bacterium]|nr:NifB/NifX family molybdenum-iron cluster-binding protein [Desulfobacteria bacterium]
MSYKIAVASSDGKVVNQHFGRATQFLIFDIKDGSYQFNELRKTSPFCKDREHDDDSLQKTVELVSDCKAVLVSQIGPG